MLLEVNKRYQIFASINVLQNTKPFKKCSIQIDTLTENGADL